MSDVQKVALLDSDLPKVVLAGPLSRKTTFALHITGPYRVREVENLMRMLSIHLEWMREDEAAAAADLPKPEAK